MSAEPKRVQSVDPSRLADLIDLDPATGTLWNVSELKSILAHQLASKCRLGLGKVHASLTNKAFEVDSVADLTFGQALTDPNPSVELLKLIKDFAKFHWHSKSSGLPKEVAMVLYYLTIASALNHGQRGITNLSNDSLRRGMNWVLEQDWVGESVKRSIRKTLDSIKD